MRTSSAKSIKAFTVLELTVSMLLVGIMTALAGMAWQFFSYEIRNWTLSQQALKDQKRGLSVLAWDLATHRIWKINGTMLYLSDETGKQSIAWQLKDVSTRGWKQGSDTFLMYVTGTEFAQVDGTWLVEEIKIKYTFQKRVLERSFRQNYSYKTIRYARN